MSPAVQAAIEFVQIVAAAEPAPGNELDRNIVNAARRISRRLRLEDFAHYDPPPLPVSRSGIPIIRSKT